MYLEKIEGHSALILGLENIKSFSISTFDSWFTIMFTTTFLRVVALC